MNEECKIDLSDNSIKDTQEPIIKVYSQPKITELGAMQKVTLGGSIGVGDSANGDSTQCTLGIDC